MKDPRLHLLHILECVTRVRTYTVGGYTVFLDDVRTQDAVIRNFEMIGEAVKRLPERVRLAAPDVPWRRLAGFRDVLIHQYDSVDVDEVWGAVENDLAVIEDGVKQALAALDATAQTKEEPPGPV